VSVKERHFEVDEEDDFRKAGTEGRESEVGKSEPSSRAPTERHSSSVIQIQRAHAH